MTELKAPAGYEIKPENIEGKKFTCMYNKERKLVLALPTQYCFQEKVDEVAQQIEGVKPC